MTSGVIPRKAETRLAMKTIFEDAREVEVKGEYDVLVVGGGPAGISASIAASRSGARTLLLERYGFLGGMATAGIAGALCGFFTTGSRQIRIVGGIAGDLLARLNQREGLSEKRTSRLHQRVAVYQYNPEVFKFAVEQAALQAGVELMLHSVAVEVVWEIKGSRLSGVIVENKSGRFAYLSRVIIDATGDGDVAFKAKVPYGMGDENGKLQSLTTMFRITNVNQDRLRELNLRELQKKLEEARRERRFNIHRVDPVIGPTLPLGMVNANMTGIPDLSGVDAEHLTRAEIEGRRQVFEYLSFLRKSVAGFERAEISSMAAQVGVRETRRIQGEYVLQEHEVLMGKKFDDAIALGAWPVEIHQAETGKIDWRFLDKEDDYYTIPLRCLLPKSIDNLIVAGRCISTTHVAQASTRVMGQAFATGEAAGVLASQSVESKTIPRKISAAAIRDKLRRHGAILEIESKMLNDHSKG